ncbi:MAG: ATP-binding protein [Candidatus Aenigmarchaeota archaeon]|nr:ATP-binding protein [Candidatus Aenigmarchaeota archaeon]
MKTITILSGKGGVGKSSITASLAITLAKRRRIICADCDVDASNLALVFGIKEKDFEEYLPISTIQKAVFDLSKCNSCRKCFEECYFDAIELVNDKPKLKEFSCEGCGVCQLVCPVDAIKLVDEKNAKIGYAKTKYGFRIFSAQLDVGASGSGKIVSAVKKKAEALAQDAEIMLVDSSAGVGCPVIASVSGSDYALLVTEPTPSGFSDMKRAIKIVNHFNIPYGIVVNKHDINEEYTKRIEEFAEKNNAQILSKIPYDKAFVKALVNLVPVVVFDKKYEKLFEEIGSKILLRL